MSDSIEKDASKLESGSQASDLHGAHNSKVEKKIFNYEGVDGHAPGQVKRVLKARQLQMIALGGTIGTGEWWYPRLEQVMRGKLTSASL